MDITTVTDELQIEYPPGTTPASILATMRERLEAIKGIEPDRYGIDYALSLLPESTPAGFDDDDLIELLSEFGLVDEFGSWPVVQEEGGETWMDIILLGLRALAPFMKPGSYFTFVRESGSGTVTWELKDGDFVDYDGTVRPRTCECT